MQQQYWNTRSSLLRRLGNKEDECVVSSDAELDAKLVLFRSIADSGALLRRLADRYLERESTLAREELALGRFLKDSGRQGGVASGGPGAASGGPGAASGGLAAAGRGVLYCGQQRGALRGTLARLAHELDTFGSRGVEDCGRTVAEVERARNRYRAALHWMKAASGELDPDSGRGLHKFRKAQAHVKDSKSQFDRITLDTLQKIDLLAAARCNMFSHALINYQNCLLNFATRASQIMESTSESLSKAENLHYDFSILKELSQNPDQQTEENQAENVDKDRLLFFQDDYKDVSEKNVSENANGGKIKETLKDLNSDLLAETAQLINTTEELFTTSATVSNDENAISDLASLNLNNFDSFLPSQLMQNNSFCEQNDLTPTRFPATTPSDTTPAKSENSTSKRKDTNKDMAAWFKLFAELDPLANPDSMPGSDKNQSHAA